MKNENKENKENIILTDEELKKEECWLTDNPPVTSCQPVHTGRIGQECEISYNEKSRFITGHCPDEIWNWVTAVSSCYFTDLQI